MVVIETINFLLASVLAFFNYSMFQALHKYKKIRSKEEDLFLEKTLVTTICFGSYLFLCLIMVLDICPNKRIAIPYQVQEYIYNVYIIALYIINFYINLEMFFTYKNPIHYYLIIFNKKSRKIYELLLILVCVIFLALNILDPLGEKNSLNLEEIEKDKKENKRENYSSPFLLLDNFKLIVMFGTNIAAIVFNFKLNFLLNKFEFGKKEKLTNIVKKKIICNFCYLAYPFYSLVTFGIYKEKEKNGKIEYEDNFLKIVIGSFIIFTILLIDSFMELFIISTTKFSQYKLRNTVVGFFGRLFPNDFGDELDIIDNIKLPKTSLDNSDEDEEDEVEEEKANSEDEANVSLIPRSPVDTELVSVFKNNIYFEDYFMSFCDQYLNIISACFNKIYSSKLFSVKSVENKKIKEEMGGISISGIGGIENMSNTAEISVTAQETDNSSSYTFQKKKGKSPFDRFKSILGPLSDEFKVKLTSYYTDNCVMNIKKLNLASKKIALSFVSHYIINAKKEDKDNPNNYWSLTAVNAKEEYFRNMKNVSFKSYDKNYNFDFFETDDQNSSKSNDLNKNIAEMIQQYFDYIQNGKGKTGTFLPELVGIFKIKVSDFSTMLVYISRNTLVENVPRNFFTYWQLLRFDKHKPKKIATSQYGRGALVTEEVLFERLYSSDIKKDKEMNKVMLKNYQDFKEIIENDIDFLKTNNLLKVNLLMMYFEYENTQKHEKDGAYKIRKAGTNKAEIINVQLPENNNNEIVDKEKSEEENILNKNTEIGSEILSKVNNSDVKNELNANNSDELKVNNSDEKDELKVDNNDEKNEIKTKNSDEIKIKKDDNKITDALFDGDDDDFFGDEGEGFDSMPDIGKEAHNLSDYVGKINIAGYEGNFDNFICMCFFTFENAFDLNNKSGSVADETLKQKILENFTEFKLKE